MSVEGLVGFAQEALLLAVRVSLPVLSAAWVISFVVSAVQGATQIADSALGYLPRVLVVTAVLIAAGPWMGGQIASFAARAFTLAP